MAVHTPVTIDAAVELLAASGEALVVAGGTDVMVEVNERRRPVAPTVIALDRIAELRSWSIDGSTVTIGAGVTYSEMMVGPLAELVPALAEAARTVGSPQIRNAGTLGGNLGTCSPAGDALPVLSALDAVVHLASAGGRRSVDVHQLMVGPKRTSLERGELIVAVTLPVVAGWQGYSKVGVRNAMVIATASAAVVIDRESRRVRIALGSVGPTVLRCQEAEQILDAGLAAGSVDRDLIERGVSAVRAASSPIDDHRSTADYRRHAVGVLAGRLVGRGLEELGWLR